MTIAILAAMAAIIGVAVGRLWDSRAESARWYRDQRIASYQRLAEAFRTSYDDAQRVAFADPNSEDFAEMVRTINVQGNHFWHDALSAVWFHGSRGAVATATNLDRSLITLHENAGREMFSADDWSRDRIPARRAFEQFVDSVRSELGQPQVSHHFYEDTAAPQTGLG
ncbi:hypothetical protein [Nocardia salmonicida]|uniref:hypothetical protein n=1 Tax=Nocardia salmonicida TaxID=53431 RepID=UPI002E2CBC6D|nr:hypothetical protein [Nocardia salmonicida]